MNLGDYSMNAMLLDSLVHQQYYRSKLTKILSPLKPKEDYQVGVENVI